MNEHLDNYRQMQGDAALRYLNRLFPRDADTPPVTGHAAFHIPDGCRKDVRDALTMLTAAMQEKGEDRPLLIKVPDASTAAFLY